MRWTGRDTGTAQRVDRADLVLLAPDATRLDEAPAGPRHELAVGPVGDDARVAAHPVHREVVRERLQIADGVPLALGTGDDVDAVVGAVGAHDDHRVVLGWIDDPANFTVTEGLVAHQPPDIEHVFAADDLAVLCAADVLVARDLDRVDPGLRARAGLGGVVLVGTEGLDDVLADPTNIEQSARSERIRAARLTLDATAAAVRFRELIDSTPVATPGASS